MSILSQATHAEAAMHMLPKASVRRWLFAAGWTLRLAPVMILILLTRGPRAFTFNNAR